MLRCYLPLAPVIASSLPHKQSYQTSPNHPTLKKFSLIAASRWEGARFDTSNEKKPFSYNKAIPFTPEDDMKRRKRQKFLEEVLDENLDLLTNLTCNPFVDSDFEKQLNEIASSLLFVARDPLVTQQNLAEMRMAGVIPMLNENYITKKDCPPHLLSMAQELLRILSTPPKATDPHHYLNKAITSINNGEDPSYSIKIAEKVFNSTFDLSQRQAAAKLYKLALEAKRQQECKSLKASLEEQKSIVKKLQATVEKLNRAPDPENPDECITFLPDPPHPRSSFK